MYKKACWSCLSCLPRSLLLKQICTFCSPGIDTSSGWTRSLSASPGQECLEELQGGCRERPRRRQRLSALAGVRIELRLEGGLDPSWYSPLLAQAGSTWACLPRAAELTRATTGHWVIFLSWIIFSRGVHCLPEPQISERGIVLCDGAGDSQRVRLAVPFGSPQAALPRSSEPPCSPPSSCRRGTGCAEQGHRPSPSAPVPAQLPPVGFPWATCYTKALPAEQRLGASRLLQSRVYVKMRRVDYGWQNQRPSPPFFPPLPAPARRLKRTKRVARCHAASRRPLPPSHLPSQQVSPSQGRAAWDQKSRPLAGFPGHLSHWKRVMKQLLF